MEGGGRSNQYRAVAEIWLWPALL